MLATVRRFAVASSEAGRVVADRARSRTPIVILQPGKVGSSTVTRSLRAAGVTSVYSLHFLSETGIRQVLEEYRRIDERAPTLVSVPDHLVRSRVWRRFLSAGFIEGAKVITIVRDPIARTVSDLFQNPEIWGVTRTRREPVDAQRASELIESHFEAFDEQGDYLCRWYERELQESFGLDPYSRPFDTDRGWRRIEGAPHELLIMRTENLNAALLDVAGEFVGRDAPIPVKPANVATQKHYADEYAQVKQELRLDPETCERVYNSRLVQHFYASEEIERMIARWSRGGATP